MLLSAPLLALLLAQTTPAAADAATAAREAAEAAQKAAEAAQKAAQAAAALAGALAPAPAPAPAAAAAPPAVAWTGTVALGLIALTGNSQTITFATSAAAERKGPEWIWGIKANAAYGQNTVPGSASQVTALNAGLQARGDRRFNEITSGYLMLGVDTDHLKSVESRPFGELGVSLIWWDHKEGDFQKSTLKTDLGFRYGREYRFQYYPVHIGPSEDPAFAEVDVVAPRLGASLRYALNKDVIFTEDVSALGNVVGTARLLFTTASKISARLGEKLSLAVSFVVSDDTVPPKGKVPADTALTVGLEVAI